LLAAVKEKNNKLNTQLMGSQVKDEVSIFDGGYENTFRMVFFTCIETTVDK
jgi:hypothetical protein